MSWMKQHGEMALVAELAVLGVRHDWRDRDR